MLMRQTLDVEFGLPEHLAVISDELGGPLQVDQSSGLIDQFNLQEPMRGRLQFEDELPMLGSHHDSNLHDGIDRNSSDAKKDDTSSPLKGRYFI